MKSGSDYCYCSEAVIVIYNSISSLRVACGGFSAFECDECLRGDDRPRFSPIGERDWVRLRDGEECDLAPRSGQY